MNANKDFIVPGNWLFDVLDFENVRGSVSGIDGGFHKANESLWLLPLQVQGWVSTRHRGDRLRPGVSLEQLGEAHDEHVEGAVEEFQAPVVGRLGHSRRQSTALDVGYLRLFRS